MSQKLKKLSKNTTEEERGNINVVNILTSIKQ